MKSLVTKCNILAEWSKEGNIYTKYGKGIVGVDELVERVGNLDH